MHYVCNVRKKVWNRTINMIIIYIYVVDPFGETKGFTQYRQCQ